MTGETKTGILLVVVDDDNDGVATITMGMAVGDPAFGFVVAGVVTLLPPATGAIVGAVVVVVIVPLVATTLHFS
jgi:hypothetical protein